MGADCARGRFGIGATLGATSSRGLIRDLDSSCARKRLTAMSVLPTDQDRLSGQGQRRQ
jgi:hypothetical protein